MLASPRSKVPLKPAIVIAIAVATAVGIGVWYWLSSGLLTSGPCDAPRAPIYLSVHFGSGEQVFVVYFPTPNAYTPEQRIGNLTYELATYSQGADLMGPGNVTRSGSLSSLNTTGSLQFHDMEAEGWFTPNDFFIFVNPPPLVVQLRILHIGTVIAFNPIIQCA